MTFAKMVCAEPSPEGACGLGGASSQQESCPPQGPQGRGQGEEAVSGETLVSGPLLQLSSPGLSLDSPHPHPRGPGLRPDQLHLHLPWGSPHDGISGLAFFWD